MSKAVRCALVVLGLLIAAGQGNADEAAAAASAQDASTAPGSAADSAATKPADTNSGGTANGTPGGGNGAANDTAPQGQKSRRAQKRTALKTGDVVRLKLKIGKFKWPSELDAAGNATAPAEPSAAKLQYTAPGCTRMSVLDVLDEGGEAKETYIMQVDKGAFGTLKLKTSLYEECKDLEASEDKPSINANSAYVRDGGVYAIKQSDLPPFAFSRSGISHGPLIVPIMVRTKDKSVSQDAKLGYYIGYEWEVIPGWSATYLLSAGVSQPVVAIDGDKTETRKTALSLGIGVIFKDVNDMQFGLIAGRDRIGHDNAGWKYENDTWIGLLMGYNVASALKK